MMTDIKTLFLRHLELCTTDFDAWMQLLHDEIVLEFPYAESIGNPLHVSGKQAVGVGIKAFLQQVPALAFINPTIYLSADPHQGFATYHADTVVPATGRRYVQSYISRFRERDGRLSFISEYYDPMKLADAFRLPAIM